MLTKRLDICRIFSLHVVRLSSFITRSNSFMKSVYLRIINHILSTSKELRIESKQNDDRDSFRSSLIE